MRTAKKKKQPKLKQDWDEKPAPMKPEIPKEIVDNFLKNKITAEDRPNVREIKCTNLFHNRYRINVWLEEFEEGFYCPRVWIKYSYFVHFVDDKIVDKTIPMKPKKDKIF